MKLSTCFKGVERRVKYREYVLSRVISREKCSRAIGTGLATLQIVCQCASIPPPGGEVTTTVVRGVMISSEKSPHRKRPDQRVASSSHLPRQHLPSVPSLNFPWGKVPLTMAVSQSRARSYLKYSQAASKRGNKIPFLRLIGNLAYFKRGLPLQQNRLTCKRKQKTS